MEYSKEALLEQGYNDAQIYEILRGIQQKLPIETYAKKAYNWLQMYEIRKGLRDELDIGLYADPFFSPQEMREIRLGLLDRLDVSQYAKFYYSRSDMKKVRHKLFRKKYYEKPSGFGRNIYDESLMIHMRISDDCMSAYMTVPSIQGKKLSVIQLENVLYKYDITYGVQKDVLKSILKDEMFDREILVAEGKKLEENQEFPYEMVTEFVKEGQWIAKYRKPEKGKTVTGISVGLPVEQGVPMNLGENVICDFEKKKYYAVRDGFVSYNQQDNTISVLPMKSMDGSPNPEKGEIRFQGSIHVKGDVKSGTKIYAAGSIYIDGFAEGSILHAGGDIVIKKGTNANNQGEIKAGGNIKGKFFEMAHLEAGGRIKADYFLKCDISAKSIEARGKKGCIRGCCILSPNPVRAAVVENNQYDDGAG